MRKIRLTGGEPLVRKNVMSLIEKLGAIPELDELTLTSNGSQLQKLAAPLREAGIKRINISLDSLDPDKFRRITRTGDLHQVLDSERVRYEPAQKHAFELSETAPDEIYVQARLLYRKIDQYLLTFIFGEDVALTSHISEMATAELRIPVVSSGD